MKFVSFELNKELYCFPISEVSEVKEYQVITPVPGQSDYFLGLVNLRGTIIPIYDLRIFLSLEAGEINSDYKILVCDYNGHKFGFIVEKVRRIVEYDGELKTVEDDRGDSTWIEGIAESEGSLIMVLSCKNILSRLREE